MQAPLTNKVHPKDFGEMFEYIRDNETQMNRPVTKSDRESHLGTEA